MKELGLASRVPGRAYLTGGATALLEGWRDATIDVDLKLVPENDEALRAIPRLKEQLEINVKLTAPSDFIPELPGWEERSRFVAEESGLAFYQYDFYSQALSKIERRHRKDLIDIHAMLDRGLIERQRCKSSTMRSSRCCSAIPHSIRALSGEPWKTSRGQVRPPSNRRKRPLMEFTLTACHEVARRCSVGSASPRCSQASGYPVHPVHPVQAFDRIDRMNRMQHRTASPRERAARPRGGPAQS